jgi:hypothetical protein
MVQDQLVEYITSQLKTGVSAETVKATLVGAGWQVADVDDTLKSLQPAQAPVQPQIQPQVQQQPKVVSSFSVGSFGGVQKAAEPQVIRVSDLVSSSDASGKVNFTSSTAAKPATVQTAQPMQIASAKTDAVMARIATGAAGGVRPTGATSATFTASIPAKKSHAIETETILGILMVAFGVAAIFFFFENRSLSGQISSLNGTSGGVSSQLTALQSQIDASTTALEAQIASTTAGSDALALSLSFYAVPPGTVATTTFTTTLEGTVSGGGKYSYVIMTPYGAKIPVSNSKDVNVIALLKSIVGGTTSAQFAGNYVPGVDTIALSAVNGVSTTPPPVAATSTATSSAGLMIPATSTTP